MSHSEIELLRPLDPGETHFWLLDRVSSSNFSVFAKGKGILDLDRLQQALKTIQSVHPSAQVGIRKSADSTHLVFVLSKNDIPLYIKNAGHDWQLSLAKDIMQIFELSDAPLIRGYVYLIQDGTWVFSLVFHHSIADGRSGIRFFKEVIAQLNSSYTFKLAQKTNIPMHASLPATKDNQNSNINSPSTMRPKNLPGFSDKQGESQPNIIIIQLENNSLARLRELAKHNSASMHGVLGAIQLKAIASLYENYPTEAIPLNLISPADARPYLTNSFNDFDLGLYTTILTSQHEVSENTSFWELARQVSNSVKSQLLSADGLLFYKQLPDSSQFLRKEKAIKHFSLLISMMQQACVLSNVGIVPDLPTPDGIDLDYIAFTLHPAITQTICITATTFRDKLQLVMNYDTKRWSKALFDKFISYYTSILSSFSR